ncbi:hypothetical protein KEM54_003424 [Ascosphaera aggregata]|nr:hypothetical protein KEM54_003424 [Ascosphaera aggregata]
MGGDTSTESIYILAPTNGNYDSQVRGGDKGEERLACRAFEEQDIIIQKRCYDLQT